MLITIFAVIAIAVFVISVRQERRRFVNIVFLLCAAGLTGCAIGNIGGSGWLYTHLISYLLFLFAIGCLLIVLVCLVAALHYRRVGKHRRSLYHLGAVVTALALIPFFYYTASTVLFGGIADSLLHLILFAAVWLVFAFLGLVFYTFLSHLMPTRLKWDYILFFDLPTADNAASMSLRLRHRLDDAIALCGKIDGRPRIILPNVQGAYDAALYLAEYGIEEDKIRILNGEAHTWRMKLSALADTPAEIKPYHAGLVLVEDYLACRIKHELSQLGLHATVIGYPSAPARWAVKILHEYQQMIHLHRIGLSIALLWWIIVAAVSLWW